MADCCKIEKICKQFIYLFITYIYITQFVILFHYIFYMEIFEEWSVTHNKWRKWFRYTGMYKDLTQGGWINHELIVNFCSLFCLFSSNTGSNGLHPSVRQYLTYRNTQEILVHYNYILITSSTITLHPRNPNNQWWPSDQQFD